MSSKPFVQIFVGIGPDLQKWCTVSTALLRGIGNPEQLETEDLKILSKLLFMMLQIMTAICEKEESVAFRTVMARVLASERLDCSCVPSDARASFQDLLRNLCAFLNQWMSKDTKKATKTCHRMSHFLKRAKVKLNGFLATASALSYAYLQRMLLTHSISKRQLQAEIQQIKQQCQRHMDTPAVNDLSRLAAQKRREIFIKRLGDSTNELCHLYSFLSETTNFQGRLAPQIFDDFVKKANNVRQGHLHIVSCCLNCAMLTNIRGLPNLAANFLPFLLSTVNGETWDSISENLKHHGSINWFKLIHTCMSADSKADREALVNMLALTAAYKTLVAFHESGCALYDCMDISYCMAIISDELCDVISSFLALAETTSPRRPVLEQQEVQGLAATATAAVDEEEILAFFPDSSILSRLAPNKELEDLFFLLPKSQFVSRFVVIHEEDFGPMIANASSQLKDVFSRGGCNEMDEQGLISAIRVISKDLVCAITRTAKESTLRQALRLLSACLKNTLDVMEDLCHGVDYRKLFHNYHEKLEHLAKMNREEFVLENALDLCMEEVHASTSSTLAAQLLVVQSLAYAIFGGFFDQHFFQEVTAAVADKTLQ